ncbi:MAG: hypothetical protein J5819_00110 [Eubacterium sp.]|nr:hypothetical protein [Eubacterium sp.]
MTKEDIEKQIHNLAEYMYKTGYEDGTKYELEHTKNIIRNHEKCKEVLDAEYERGLNDAWRAARWIMDLTSDDIKRHDVIGDCAPKYALTKYSADEAIELIKEYEEKQAEKKCMNCGNMNPHYDTFRCNVMGNCVGREKWIPK